MNSDKPNIADILNDAIAIESTHERGAFLEQACGEDVELRCRVEQLLQYHFHAGEFLERPANANATVLKSQIQEKAGDEIGRYKLLEEIAEGGMGTVWVAQQIEPVRRRVALKLIKPGMDSRQVLTRFEAERQALALMDHPNIAKVLDGGVTDKGRPYFVMEYVKGVPITEFCDDARLPVRERLALFVQVCQAVQHAHQKGIIHRDLKPSNILVCLYDGQPVPKVIDFGLAKALYQPLTEQTVYTAHGLMVGTPLYMSPEQAEFNNLDIDTRSDVYSLGVILYELLTGTTPLEKQQLREAAWQEIVRLIKESEPAKPSTRLTTGASLPKIAAQRSLEPSQLSRAVRGDLDWIVMKSLEKERSRRYETANGLARDVQRYLVDELVEARPPSATYRMLKIIRRNKVAISTAALVICAMVLGTAISVWQAVRATQAEAVARDQRARAEENAQLAEHSRSLAESARQDAETQRDRAIHAEKQSEANFQNARRAVDDMYTQVAEKWLNRQPKLEPLQREFLQKALRFYEEFAHKSSSEPEVRFEAALAYRRVAEIQFRLGQSALAEKSFQQTIERLQHLSNEFPKTPAYPQKLANTLHHYGTLIGEIGRPIDEFRAHRRALALKKRLVDDFPGVTEYRNDLGIGYMYAGGGTGTNGVVSQWELLKARDIQSELVSENPANAEYRKNLAFTHYRLGNFREAAAIQELLVAENPNDPDLRSAWSDSVGQFSNGAPYLEKETLVHKTLEIQDKLANDFPSVSYFRYQQARTLQKLAVYLLENKRVAEAGEAYRRGIAILEKLATESPETFYFATKWCTLCEGLGGVLMQQGSLVEAEAMYEKSLNRLRQVESASGRPDLVRSNVCNCYAGLAGVYLAAGRQADAKVALEKLNSLDRIDPFLRTNTAWMLMDNANPNAAVEMARQAVELAPAMDLSWETLGVAQYRAGNMKDAVEALSKSLACTAGDDQSDLVIFLDFVFLAMAQAQLGQTESASQWFDAAIRCKQVYHDRDPTLTRFLNEAQRVLKLEQLPVAALKTGEDAELELHSLCCRIAPDAAWAFARRSQVFERLGRADAAKLDRDKVTELYTQWISSHPQDSVALIGRARFLGKQSRFEQAIADCLRAIELSPRQIAGWEALAGIHCELEHWADGAESFKHVFELSDSTLNGYRMALCQLGAGDLRAYQESCARLLQFAMTKNDADAAQWAAWIAVIGPGAIDGSPDVERVADMAVRASGTSAMRALTILGAVHFRSGRFREALEVLQEAELDWEESNASLTKFDPAYTWFFLLMTQQSLGQLDDARATYQKAANRMNQVLRGETREPGDSSTGTLARETVLWNRKLTLTLLDSEARKRLNAVPTTAGAAGEPKSP